MSLVIAITFIIVGSLVLISTFDIKLKQLPSPISSAIRSISLVKHISKTNILIIRYIILLLFVVFILYSILVSHLLEGFTEKDTPSPVNGPKSLPINNPSSSQVNGPKSSPVNGPISSPVNSPTSSPMSGPSSSPVSGPTSSPMSGPSSSPMSNPTSSPMSGPTSSPMSGPTSSPMDGSGSTPLANDSTGSSSQGSAGDSAGDSSGSPSEGSNVEGGNDTANFNVDMNTIDVPPIYYQPGSIMFNGGGPIPSYEDLYVSSVTNLTQVGFVDNAPYLSGGFCEKYAHDTVGLEKKCNSLSNDVCASTDCCVLLGGQKCVAGNVQGPLIQSNFSDVTVKNRDMYFHKGKCYGNCPNNDKSS